MKKTILFLIIFVAMLTAAYFTNPPVEKHRETAKVKIENIIENTVKTYHLPYEWLMNKQTYPTEELVDYVADNYVYADNYYFFSLTKVKMETHNQSVGIGVFGHVFISEKVEEIAQQEIDSFVKKKANELLPWLN